MYGLFLKINVWLFALIFSCTLGCSGQLEGFLSSKGEVLYENRLSQRSAIDDWILEGPAVLDFKDGWMEMHSPDETGHHVLWCPEDFPKNFIAEWEVQNLALDAGLCIVFFSAIGENGENIFDPQLNPRDGIFEKYTKSDINSYHISYYAHTPKLPNRSHAHLRKNQGFHMVSQGEPPLSVVSSAIHQMSLIRSGDRILMYIDDRKIIDWRDDGKAHGPVLGSGKIGLRQMRWTHFRYRNFKVSAI